MSSCCQRPPLNVALLGNPNTGKSTVFSALAGMHQRVGNYPGVTVEKKTGLLQVGTRRYTLIDLPGLYSLSPRSRDEMVSVHVLLGHFHDLPAVDLVLCIVDASNLERNLYLVSQVLELGVPTVLALNMLDVAEAQGVTVDVPRLTRELGIPVVPMQANRGIGVTELKDALNRASEHGHAAASPLPEVVQQEVERLSALAVRETGSGEGDRLPLGKRSGRPYPQRDSSRGAAGRLPAWFVARLLLDVGDRMLEAGFAGTGGALREELQAARARLAAAGCSLPGVETVARYQWTSRVMAAAVARPDHYRATASDGVDRVLTHRVWGTAVFAFVMVAMFQSVFVWARPLMSGIDASIKLVAGSVGAWMTEGALRSLLVDGVLGGVGSVLTFLPQILILFLFLAVLEDCGYMARAAYLMDRWMVRVGLSGKSFIPLLSCFACAVPGIMATRVIENERDRMTTILVAPLMTCSARLPIYALLIATFIPQRSYLGGLLNLQGLTLVALYLLGILTAVAVARVLKRTILRGEAPPFLMELPTYKWPSPRTVFFRVMERGYAFLHFAGTVILAVSILVWAALYYPHRAETVEAPFRAQKERLQGQLAALPDDHPQRAEVLGQWADLQREIAGAYQRQSILGRFGRLVEPVFRPLGWDWRIGSAVIASFPAREIVVATLGVIFNLGDEIDPRAPEDATQLNARLHAATWEGSPRPLFTVPVALSIMVFFALCAQCAGTLAVIRQETNSWRWPLVTFAYMTTLAYAGAWVTYRVGTWLAG